MQRLLVLRHATSLWNQEGRWQGWLDSPLAAEGEVEAAARAVELAHDGVLPRAIYTSDLSRAQRTAEIIAAHLECPVVPDADLRERHGGEWQGKTRDEIEASWPGQRDAWRRGELRAPPGGETDEAVLERVDRALASALEHVGKNTMLVVTHHGVVRQLSSRAGVTARTLIPNVGGFWFGVNGGELVDPEPVDILPSDDERPAVE